MFDVEELKERLNEFLGTETVLNEVFKWLDTDTKIRIIDDIMRTYDLDIAE